MDTLAAAWTIAVKDLRCYARDRLGLLLGFLLPIALVTVFGFIMSVAFGGGSGMPKAELWISDQDDSESSRKFVGQLRDAEMLKVRPRKDDPPATAEDIRRRVTDGESPLGLVIERGFGDALRQGKLPKLGLFRDPGRTMEDRVVRISLVQAFLAVSEGELWPTAIGDMLRRAGMNDEQVQQIVQASQEMQRVIKRFADKPPVRDAKVSQGDATAKGDGNASHEAPPEFADFMGHVVPIENVDIQPPQRPKMLSYQLAQSVCGMTVMMAMFGLVGCSTMLLYERESGTLRRMLVSAVPRDAILWGKFLFCVVVGVAQLAVLFVYGNMVFAIDAFRDVPTLAVVSLTWIAAATSFGMLIAAWAQSAKQADGISTLLILVMAALGGCWFPIQMMDLPLAAEIVTRSTITYWAMSAYQGLFWQQQSWLDGKMLTALSVQWAFAAIAAAVALTLFRRRYVAG